MKEALYKLNNLDTNRSNPSSIVNGDRVVFKDIIDVMKGSKLSSGDEESKEYMNKDDLTNYSKVLGSSKAFNKRQSVR